jgi:transcription initiation factor TFIIF subunit beta
MATGGVKMEEDVKIKPDPELDSPASFADDDRYEDDAGELKFPNEKPIVWLAKVPRWLWEALSTSQYEEQKRIADLTIINNETDPKLNRIRLQFSQDWQKMGGLPKVFDMSYPALDRAPENTWIFSEKDQPGYKPRNAGRTKQELAAQRDAARAGNSGRINKRQRFRKAIPSMCATGLNTWRVD